jgi:hypothetical protein
MGPMKSSWGTPPSRTAPPLCTHHELLPELVGCDESFAQQLKSLLGGLLPLK